MNQVEGLSSAAKRRQAPSRVCTSDPVTCAAAIASAAAANSRRYDAVDPGYVSELANEPTITGILRDWTWREVEPSKGERDFWEIDAYLKAVKTLLTPKRLIIRIEDRTFGGQKGAVVSIT
jgi:hypothetical protein